MPPEPSPPGRSVACARGADSDCPARLGPFHLSPAACTSYIDVVVVCDESNSIYPWEAVKNFLEKFVQGLDIGPTKTQVWA